MTTKLVQSLLPTIDAARSLLDDFGLRPYKVAVRVTRWSGEVVGEGVGTSEDTFLKVGKGNPKVKIMSTRDVVASGGEVTDVQYLVGPLTPDYGTGGTKISQINPPTVDDEPVEIKFVVFGPDLPKEGALCNRISGTADSPFRYTVTLRRTGGGNV